MPSATPQEVPGGAEPRRLNLIVSCAENRVIGRDGRLPWRIPEDFRFFDDKTAGQIAVLGRICFESWPEASARGRRPVVVTSHPERLPASARGAPSLPAALGLAYALPGEIFICGGERIYAEALAHPGPLRLYLTLVHAEVSGDRHFPEWRHLRWREIERRESADEKFSYSFITLEKP
jgi:dihydrofolate reductase